ncbi:hypothetical protein U9M48_020114 [Paspalum notatum var. saurae]|uniref:Uncharacterized protein n=1 Tax=Paspalum notatum var. saurae TaxID=547442 RepID=A0AAQ3TEV5_PASNO
MEGATEERDESRAAADDAAGRPPPPRQAASSHVVRVSFSSPSSRSRPSCWGRLKIRRIGRSSAHSRRSGMGMGGGDENGATTPSAAAASSRACRGRCGCRGVPDAAAGARSLLQRNDFYCDDCNTHRLSMSICLVGILLLMHGTHLCPHLSYDPWAAGQTS